MARANGPGSPPQGVALGFDYKENFYTATHTYSQTGVYTIFMTDPNRNGGVLNVNFPNSDQIKFHIETTVTLLNVGGGMENRSPRVLARPILLGHLGQPFVYAPEAYDPDADSLSFELTVPLQDSGAVVPNYVELTGIDPGPDNQLSFDPYSGKLVWDSPQQVGQYNFAILIWSFRDGVEIGVTILDLEIVIGNFGNTIPTLSISPAYTESHIHCLSVGDTLELSFTAQDEAPGEEATLEFFSGFNKKLEYTIRFQNTGNDTAFTVVLRDTLDANLDWNTFAPFSSSHPYEFVLDQRTGVLIFTFRDINLPDSTTNEVASHGFVSYTISSRAGLAENTLVSNRAGIYFDSNPPIITNTTGNTLVSQIPGLNAAESIRPAEGLEAKVYPNPFSEAAHFEIQSQQEQPLLLEIFDLSGRRLYSKAEIVLPGSTTITLSGLQLPGKGTFIYRISTQEGVRCGKMMRME